MRYTFERSNINVVANEEKRENIVRGTHGGRITCPRIAHASRSMDGSYNEDAESVYVELEATEGLRGTNYCVNFERGRKKK